MIDMLDALKDAIGLSGAQCDTVAELVDVYRRVSPRNAELDGYYEGKVRVPELGLTIDRNDFVQARSAIACYWPEKVVDALADRIRLRAISDGTEDDLAAEIVYANNIVGQYDGTRWKVDYSTRSAGEPMMYAFVHRQTGEKPFGKSRITKFVKGLTQSAVRVLWDAEVSAALYAMPKDALLGLSDDQYDAIMSNKQKAYMDSLLAATTNDDGGTPTLQRLTANSPEVYRTQLNMLGAQLSGATGTPLNSLGIVQDNPSSAEAIQASREDICLIAEKQIEADRESMRNLLRCAVAVATNQSVDGLANAERDIRVIYAEPMLNSRAALADFAVKFAAVREGFGGTRTCARMCGFDEDSILEMEAEERRGRANAMVDMLMAGEEDDEV